MEATPKRIRRVQADPPSGPAVRQPKSRSRLLASVLHELASDEPSCAKASTACSSGAAPEGLTEVAPGLSSIAQEVAATDTVSFAADVGAAAAATSTGSKRDAGGEGVACLAVTRADQGCIEFELDGKVYRVRDTAAFAEAVAAGPKPPRRSLTALRRAQRADRAARCTVAEAEADVPVPAPAQAEAKAGQAEASLRHSAQTEAVVRALQAASASLGAPAATSSTDGSTQTVWGSPSLAEEMLHAAAA
mmetsp:Transcript_73250/g.214771  ORF Transcript_73250/g.214771 Transcript_73250/m.214771 type:complete len:248 (+) Transcript_73250:69-812(+)